MAGGRDWIEEKILSFFEFEGFYFCKKGIYYEAKDMGPVAQLDRASPPGVEGHEFRISSGVPFFLPFLPQNPGSEAFLLFAAESCKMVQIE